MNLLVLLTPLTIYHGSSTRNTFREEHFTVGEFTYVNMKKYGRHNIRRHRDIKDRGSTPSPFS